MSSINQSISGGTIVLPGHSTPFERAIAGVDARILDLPADLIRQVKRVADCPAHLLSHLAWERSVDVWDPSWPDDLKRRVIAASYLVHRYKGTRYAVELALEALGFKTKITEWWQAAPQAEPYTFHVRAFALERMVAGQPVITEPMTRAALASVIAAKPVSRTFTFDVAAGVSTRAVIGARARMLQIAPPAVIAAPPKVAAVRFSAAVRGRAVQVAQSSGPCDPNKTPVARISIATRIRAMQIVNARMEAIAA